MSTQASSHSEWQARDLKDQEQQAHNSNLIADEKAPQEAHEPVDQPCHSRLTECLIFLRILPLSICTTYLLMHWLDYICEVAAQNDRLSDLLYRTSYGIAACIAIWSLKHGRPQVRLYIAITVAFAMAQEYLAYRLQGDGFSHGYEANLRATLCCLQCAVPAICRYIRKPKKRNSDISSCVQGSDAEKALEPKSEDEPVLKTYQGTVFKVHSFAGIPLYRTPWRANWESYAPPGSFADDLVRKPRTTAIALFLAFSATIATMVVHPPSEITQALSSINCKAHTLDIYGDKTHYEFSVSDRNGTLSSSCRYEAQQLASLASVMDEHIFGVGLGCGVWCLRREDDGDLVGFISKNGGFGLVDMYYCRGEYAAFGDSCEVEGDDYGFDVSKEGWMNDVYGWSLHEEEVDPRTGEVVPLMG